MKTEHKAINLRSLTLMFVLFLSSVFGLLYAYILKSNESWMNETQTEIQKSRYLNNAMSILGYTGFIHSFKNAVLRKDFEYLVKAQYQVELGIDALDKYAALSPKHQQSVQNIKIVIRKYQSKLDELRTLINSDQHAEEIDTLVKVDDQQAIMAIRSIMNDSERSPIELLQSANSTQNKVFFVLQIMLWVLLVVSLLFFIVAFYLSKKLNHKYRETELLFSCAPDAIFTTNEEGLITYANQETLTLFGIPNEMISNIHVDQLVPVMMRERHKKLRENFQKTDRIRPMNQVDMVFHGQKFNGEVFPASISVATTRIGKEKHNVVVVKDLSQELHYKKIANTDSLTKVANRRAINKYLQERLLQYNEDRLRFSICLFDLDHFKQVNDRFGHLVGDEVLTKVTKIINQELGDQGFIGRWGGEEFMVILPGTNLEDAKEFAERVRLSIMTHSAQEAFPCDLTISAGVTSVTKHDDLDDLINKSDKALYHSKENGRNQVSLV